MSNEPTQEISSNKIRGRLLRSRWLWGVVVLLVVAVGSKAIHRAMQPQHEGKTKEEWFAEYKLEGPMKLEESKGVPFQKLGTNAVWYLWGEYTRKDSKATAWLMAQKDRWLGTKRPTWVSTHENERQAKALMIMRELGPAAEPLIPEIILRLKSPDLNEAATMAHFLAEIHRQPDVVVPAIHQALVSTNWQMDQRLHYVRVLGMFGPQARSALPELQSRLGSPAYTNRADTFYLARSILQINGPGPELGIFTNSLVPGDIHKSILALRHLGDVGTNAWPAVPVLREFAKTLTNESDIWIVTNAIYKIDPEGVYPRP